MYQLKWDENLEEIIWDIPYWQTANDIPSNIQKYIEEISSKRVVYDFKTKHICCSKCLEELNSDNYCAYCHIQYPNFTKDNIDEGQIFLNKSSNLKNIDFTFKYYVFDIVDNIIFLYVIRENITYYNPLSLIPYQNSYLDIAKAYLVKKDGLTDLKTNKFISFEFLNTLNQKLETNDDYWENIDDEEFNIYETIFLDIPTSYVYSSNLNELKNTIYKYTKIWLLQDYFRKHQNYSLASLTLYPLFFPQFEYLINYQLYDLALSNPSYFKSGHNFYEIFGLDKKYLPFMTKYNLKFNEYCLLKLCKLEDIATLNFFSKYYNYYDHQIETLVLDYKINLTTLKDYLLKSSHHDFLEYLDYINMAQELQLDLDNKKLLYPKNLRAAHDKLFDELKVIDDPKIDGKIKTLSSILTLNNYEDEKYLIFPASSSASLVLESKGQKNCVRLYGERIANNECQIYFMRKKSNPEKSFITIEVADNHVVQARLKYNKMPSEEIFNILKKWEKTLIPLIIQN